tara:strand:- start:1049 stop:2506 length:1458 start_codon:yes stop_codon:yes gene_type:complete
VKQGGNIEDWYRDELSNFEVNPETNGWESISNQLDNTAPLTDENIESWYIKELEKFQSVPDKTVWNKLSTKLDVASVWDKLLVSLNRYDKIIWWRNTMLKSSALLLLLIGGYYTFTNIGGEEAAILTNNIVYNHTENGGQLSAIENNNENDVIEGIVFEKKEGNEESLFQSDESQQVGSNDKIQRPKLSTVVQRGTSVNNKGKNETLLASTTNNIDKVISLKVGNLSQDFPLASLSNNSISNTNLETKTLEAKEFLVKKNQNKIIFNSKRFSSHFVFGMYARRLYFGINGGAKYQTLFASSKQNEALSHFNKKQLMDFGGSFGATVGLIVSDKFNLEVNVNLLSTSGSKHQYSLNENNFIDEINLEYSTVSILAKKMNNKSTFDNKKYSTNYIGGLYAGFLTAAESYVDGKTTTIKDQFTSTDIGIVLGIEQDRYITKELVITPGIRFNQSLLNTSKSLNEIMNTSRNFSVEFNVGLKYIFLKKN